MKYETRARGYKKWLTGNPQNQKCSLSNKKIKNKWNEMKQIIIIKKTLTDEINFKLSMPWIHSHRTEK